MSKINDSAFLCRGKSVETNEWVEGYYIPSVFTSPSTGEKVIRIFLGTVEKHVEVIPETICIYSGHEDYLGKKIYSGDILRDDFNDELEIVLWKNDHFVVVSKSYEWDAYECKLQYREIVGNIFDNSETAGEILSGYSEK